MRISDLSTRRSMLQTMVLVELAREPARSIEQLAGRIEKLRPSVSRSLKLLRAEGLVTREEGAWRLTPPGSEEATRANQEMKSLTEAFRQAVAAVAPPTLVSESLAESLSQAIRIHEPARLNLVAQNLKSSLNAASLRQAGLLHEAATKFVVPLASIVQTQEAFMRTMSQSIRPLLEAQERNAKLLGGVAESFQNAHAESIMRSINLTLSGTLEDTFALRAAGLRLAATQPSFTWFAPVSVHLPKITQSLGKLLSDGLAGLSQDSTLAPAWIDRAFGSPPFATAGYARSLRMSFDSDFDSPVSLGRERDRGSLRLAMMLRDLGPHFVEKHEGMWSAFEKRGPDSLRHAATSARELVRNVLEYFVPGIDLSEDEKGSLIKARIKRIVQSDSGATWVTHFALGVTGYYKKLNGFTHGDAKEEEELYAMITATEGMLLYFLVAPRGKESTFDDEI